MLRLAEGVGKVWNGKMGIGNGAGEVDKFGRGDGRWS